MSGRQRVKSCEDHRDFVAGCTPCRDKASRYERQRKLERMRGHVRLVDPTGTQRRLQALAALGWSAEVLAARLAMQATDVRRIMRGEPGKVRSVVAARVRSVYDALSMTPGPSTVSKARALAKGWLPPLAWDDDELDEPTARPALAGAPTRADVDVDEAAVLRRAEGDRRVPLTHAERRQVVALLHRRGLPDTEIAYRAGIHERQVIRDRARLGLPAHRSPRRLEQATA